MTRAPDPTSAPRDGFVLAATGDLYRRLAVTTATSLKAHHPDLPVDLYTDAGVDDPVFDAVHLLEAETIRPKIPALIQTRFERAIYLDVDLVLVAPIADVFELLGRYDMAMCHDMWRNCHPTRVVWDYTPPAAFPQFNSGVVGVRKSAATQAVLTRWQAGFEAHGAKVDQPALRQVLWEDDTLRLATLPDEYNFWDTRLLDRMSTRYAAPRVLHSNVFRRPRVMAAKGQEVETYLGHARFARLQALLAADGTLTGGPPEPRIPRAAKLRHLIGQLRDLPRKLRVAAGQRYP